MRTEEDKNLLTIFKNALTKCDIRQGVFKNSLKTFNWVIAIRSELQYEYYRYSSWNYLLQFRYRS